MEMRILVEFNGQYVSHTFPFFILYLARIRLDKYILSTMLSTYIINFLFYPLTIQNQRHYMVDLIKASLYKEISPPTARGYYSNNSCRRRLPDLAVWGYEGVQTRCRVYAGTVSKQERIMELFCRLQLLSVGTDNYVICVSVCQTILSARFQKYIFMTVISVRMQ